MFFNFRTLFRSIGFDSPVAYASLASITPVIMGPVTILLIAAKFTPEIQGYYYTFASFAALQFLAELGLGQAIIQFASHEWSKLELDNRGWIIGDREALSRLTSLARQAIKWFCVLAVLFTVVLGLVGVVQFSSSSAHGIQWKGPWIVFCLCVGLNFILLPLFYLLQGCNQVAEYWFYRWIQQAVNGISLWIAISLGAALWTLSIAALAGLIWTSYFVISRFWNFFRSLIQPVIDKNALNWRTEIWPMQWRIAISWTSAYLTPQLFVPILFSFSGPVAAGQMGMTNTLGGIILAISSSWIITKGPRFGILIAQKKYGELDFEFRRSFLSSLMTALIGAFGIWGLAFCLISTRQPIGQRILPLLPLCLFLIGTVFNSLTTSLAVYLRAHKREPLAGVYLVGSMLIIGFAFLLGKRFGATGVNSGYLLAVALVQFPCALFIFSRSRKTWHAETT